jgi:argininosuccinate synthase
MDLVTFEEGSGTYDHHDAEGFIKLNGLRLKSWAARNGIARPGTCGSERIKVSVALPLRPLSQAEDAFH